MSDPSRAARVWHSLPALDPETFVQRLRDRGVARYHHRHRFHLRMHEGTLTRRELQSWVINRYYYQSRIPIKDAYILTKSDDPAFRRLWLRRIVDQDGHSEEDGGLGQWQRLGEALGVPCAEIVSFEGVHPGVRFACDAYVSLVRDATLVEAVASSLTEIFAPDLMSERIVAFETHYSWVDSGALEYFRGRVHRATRDSQEALAFVVEHAATRAEQERCIAALVRKTEILWHLLDCVDAASVGEGQA